MNKKNNNKHWFVFSLKISLLRIMSSAYFSWNRHAVVSEYCWVPVCVITYVFISVDVFFHCGLKGPYLFILPYLFRLLPFSCRRLINRRTSKREMKGKKKTRGEGDRERERLKIMWPHLNFFLIILSNFNVQT